MGGFNIKTADLKKDITIIEWLDTLNPRPTTERNYLLSMQAFTEWTGKDPEELLIEAEDEIKAGKLMRQRKIKGYLIGFRKHLQDTEHAPNTIKGYMTGVKSFYRLFDIELPTLPRMREKAQPLEKHKTIPTKDDIREVLKVCDPLEKAILLVGVSSGLSANEIINLKVRDFKTSYEPQTKITTLVLRRGKVGFDFVTFLSPEASGAVLDYLNFRGRTEKTGQIKRLKQLEKQRVFKDDDFLFIRRHISCSYLEIKDEEERRLDRDAFMKIYRIISEKAQKNTPPRVWNLIRSHNMRKFFNSAMLNAGADSFFVEFLMGHTLDDTRSAYFRATPEKLKEIYQKFVPFLTIQKDLDISESPEYQKIKKENQVLQAETARHVVERSELQEIKVKLEKMEEWTNIFHSELLPLAAKDAAIFENSIKPSDKK
ncbi:tyrosine-type recombinase/integrase [Methanosarcina sp.]|uniref:tyrosine-type recombinase/integrase n=1 Tax=Methanosarcina sp. TaxID=2213 RepID=UPI003BB4FB83